LGIDPEGVAQQLSRALDCAVVTPQHLARELSGSIPEDGGDDRAQAAIGRAAVENALIDAAFSRPLLIVNCGGEYVFGGPEALRVRLMASFERRVQWLSEQAGMSPAEATRAIETGVRNGAETRYVVGPHRAASEPRPDRYHLLLNFDTLGSSGCAEMIAAAAMRFPAGALDAAAARRARARAQARLARTLSTGPEIDSATGQRFAHPSERMFARLLDFYRIPWEYEPRTFALEHDDAGNVTEAFTPDFYLPAHDLYIELTTMKQRLVTRKNRKLRRLNELFPEIRIRILYQRDLEDLAFRLGVDGGSVLRSPLPAMTTVSS
jgi:hypothetical protein